ncbi:MAG: PTS glucose transporter subunit IIA [Clostridiales bacterium]|nr:PTS glucose transporter subunit IIA [Clostridiales bacterium]
MADINIAKQIIDAVGGEGNVKIFSHCMTRLRFNLYDESKANDEAAKKISVVKGISRPNGQYQMILGTGTVDEYFDLIVATYKFNEEGQSAPDVAGGTDGKKEGNPVFNAFTHGLDIVSGSIVPWLGCIMGALMISAILSIFTSLGLLSTESGTYLFFSTVSGACVYSFPILIGFTAAEKMQTNKYMGALIGAIMIYPSLMDAISEGTVSIFGLSIQNFSYTSTIVPIILAVWLLKYVEKLAKKICPKVIYIFGVTLIELIITVPLVYLIVGPIGMVITNAISNCVLFISNHAGFLAPAIAGAIMPLAVMAGVHYGLFPIATVMISDLGYDPIIHPALMVYNMSLAGAALAYGVKSKNPDDKSVGISSGVSGIVGISEAGLFGVVLANKRILATTEVAILISGIITGLVGYKCYVPLSQSIFSIPAAAHGDFNLMACIISLVSGVAAGFIVTYLFGGIGAEAKQADVPDGGVAEIPADDKAEEKKITDSVEVTDEAIVAPADGEIIDIATVPDPVFAEQVLGKSTAFRYPGDSVVLCSPANGKISVLDSHAYGVTMNNGVELLVHCGIDTVQANGEGFKLKDKKPGDPVKAGDPIVEVDLKKLSEKYDMSVMLVIVDSKEQPFEFVTPGPIKRGQSVLK